MRGKLFKLRATTALRYQYIVLKYLQGEPKYYQDYCQMLQQQKAKKLEANRKKKQRKHAQAAKAGVELDRQVRAAKLQSQEARTQKLAKHMQERLATQETRKDAEAGSSATAALDFIPQHEDTESTTAAVKKQAQAVAENQHEKLRKKSERVGSGVPATELVTQDVPQQLEEPVHHPPQVVVPKKVKKLYQSLYSLSPRLTRTEAKKLLHGVGLTINQAAGKGSHTKCTFTVGETITDQAGATVMQCPDLQDLMTIIPKWKGDDIPDYMVKNLKYVLEKIGAVELDNQEAQAD